MSVWILAVGLASADDALRATVADLLSGYEDPPRAEELRRLGAGVEAELLAIGQDPAQSRSRRERAVYALGWFPSAMAHAFVEGLATSPVADSHLRRSAVWALANGWGDAAIGSIGTALASEDVQLRNQAARALGRLGTPAAVAALKTRLGDEPNAMVREAISAAIGGR